MYVAKHAKEAHSSHKRKCSYVNNLFILRHLLPPWSRDLLEKLTDSQLVKKFLAFYRTRRFITALTRVRHLSLSYAYWTTMNQIQLALQHLLYTLQTKFNQNWFGHFKGKKISSNCKTYRPIFNLLTPNVNYSGRTAPLTSKVAFFIFIQQIYVLNIFNMVHTLRFFLFKMQFVS